MRCRQSRQIPAATLPRTLAACLSDDRLYLQREPAALVLVAAAGAVRGQLGVRQTPLPASSLSVQLRNTQDSSGADRSRTNPSRTSQTPTAAIEHIQRPVERVLRESPAPGIQVPARSLDDRLDSLPPLVISFQPATH